MALAVSAGVCRPGGRTVVVVTGFGLAPAVEGGVICACTGPARPMTNKVAESAVLMTNLMALQVLSIMHI